jgi:hypothetical protein
MCHHPVPFVLSTDVLQSAAVLCSDVIIARPEIWLLFVAALAHDFSEILNNTTTEEDGIVRFMCQIESVPKAMISWERNGKPLPHNGRYGNVYIIMS